MSKMVKFVLAVSVLLFVGCGSLDKPSNEKVVGGKVVVDLDGDSIKASLIAAGTPGVDEGTTVYGYKAYKIPYTTTNEEGDSVEVSGLMVVPTGLPDIVYSTLGLSLVSDDHSTIFANRDAPTEIASAANAPDGSPIILTSLGGFVTLQPDYIGFGDSNDHYHPFILQESLANASIDFIKAAQIFASNNDINLNGQLFLTGYSEGGYAAMATLKKIEETNTGLAVTMAAPMAGPYTVEGLAIEVLNQPTLSVPSFMAYIGYAYGLAYDKEISTIVNEPYASELETLFNGDLNRTQIDPELTTVTTGDDGLFVQEFVDDVTNLANTEHWFRKAAKANDVYNWVPQTSVRLIHCEGDEVIPYAISENTFGFMTTFGAPDVELIPVEAEYGLPPVVGHSACGSLAYGVATDRFAAKRLTTIGY